MAAKHVMRLATSSALASVRCATVAKRTTAGWHWQEWARHSLRVARKQLEGKKLAMPKQARRDWMMPTLKKKQRATRSATHDV